MLVGLLFILSPISITLKDNRMLFIRLQALVIILLLGFVPQLSAQQYYQKLFGDTLVNERGVTAYQRADGSMLVIGATEAGNFGGYDVMTFLVDAQGNRISKIENFGTPHLDFPNSFFYKDGIVTIVGETMQFSPFNLDGFILRLDTMGNFIDFNTYGAADKSEQFYDVVPTQDGGFAVSGFGSTVGGVASDFYVAKFDANSAFQWDAFYDFGSSESGMTLVQTPDKGFVLMGDVLQPGGNYNLGLVKIDSLGNLRWNKTLQEPYNGGCKNAIINSLGDIVVVGEMSTATSSSFDIYLARVSINGDSLFSGHIVGGEGGDAGFDIYEENPNKYLIVGYNDNNGQSDLGVTEVDSMGNILQQSFYGGGGALLDIGYGIQPSVNGGYIAIGRGQSTPNDEQVFVIYDYFSPFLATDEHFSAAAHLQLYPNPSSDYLLLDFELAERSDLSIELYSINGSLIRRTHAGTFAGKQQLQINTQDLAAGVYFVRLSSSEKSISKRFVVQR